MVGLLAAHAPVGVGIGATAIASAGMASGGYWLFLNQMYLSNAALGTGMILITGLACLTARGVVDEMARRQLRSAFGQYLSPQMVRTIERSGTAPELGGVTTEISVMFMDVRGFTTLSESMSANPQALTRLINIILDEASEVIMAHGGTLDKFIGDCVMAFWNAPLAQPDHHGRAVDAAIALQNHVPEINARLRREIGMPGRRRDQYRRRRCQRHRRRGQFRITHPPVLFGCRGHGQPRGAAGALQQTDRPSPHLCRRHRAWCRARPSQDRRNHGARPQRRRTDLQLAPA